jgi:trimethylamine:corrinoid methyltransferase-like protein
MEKCTLKGFTRNFKPLELLNEEQMAQIERGVCYILEKVGLKFEGETQNVLKIFKEGGCSVDSSKKIVKFFPSLVKDCIDKCPGHFRIEEVGTIPGIYLDKQHTRNWWKNERDNRYT